MRRWLIALAVLTACRPSDRPAVGPSVEDDAGRTVTLAGPARRVVSLLPSFTELMFAIGSGDRLVGRTAWCDYPPAAVAVPSVGDGMPPNVEAVAARRPDLVLLYHSGTNLTAAEQLARLGIPAVLLRLDRLEDLGPAARLIGRLTGRQAPAESLAAAMDSLAAAKPPTSSPQTLVFVVWDNPPIVIGHGSYLDRLAALAGARNVFTDVAAPSAQVSLETIAARDPDWVAVLSDSAGPPAFAARREWRAVRAVREGRFLHLPGSLFGRPGPRSGHAVAELRARLEAAR
ncbi:MAG TPA: helical backbone metal receptor [Gemmatimonadales bacterium]|jgi:ABC-type Fe3+-hydroxamate transport system substrate-binding protein|nr:helical backbone metal receptor [Gemmatimonadales bacterium]